jgi:hypothetical protein
VEEIAGFAEQKDRTVMLTQVTQQRVEKAACAFAEQKDRTVMLTLG